jgi:hypothetical protein
MLIVAVVILGFAALLGSLLAVLHLRSEGGARPAWPLGGLHGFLALGGLGCLLAGLGGPPRGLGTGTASFGIIAAGLIALAALVGGGILVLRLFRRRLAGALIGVHATLAVSGFVMLAAYILVG